MRYAQVVVHVPLVSSLPPERETLQVTAPRPYAWLDRSFTYEVPEELREAIRVGQLVWVPFGPRRLQGVVVDLAESSDLEETREIEAIVYPEPLLTLRQIDLARWMSHRYLAPLADCIWLFLPPGIEDKVETFYELAPDADTTGLTDKQRAVAEQIREAGTLKSTQLSLTQRGTVNALVTRGIVIKRTAVRPGKAKPRRVDTVQLVVSPATARAIIEGLDRRTAILRALAAAQTPLTLEELGAQVRASESTLAKLEDDTLIERVPARARYQLTQRYFDEVPRLPMQLARICVYLREHSHSATPAELETAVQATPRALNQLRAQGWVEKIEEPERYARRDHAAVPSPSPAQTRLLQVVQFLASQKDAVWVSAVYAATDARRADLAKLEQLGIVALASAEVVRDPLAGKTFTPVPPPTLTSEQRAAWSEIERALEPARAPRAQPAAFLLHGVTGSGKTELYLDAIDRILVQGKQAIALVPEISLTPQTIRRFGARFGERIGIIHSRLTPGERYDTWRRVRDGEIDVVIGARSALFAPLPRLGLVIVDEEHDASYRSDVEFANTPAYHARELALEMARSHNAVVILGSATPDVETYARALSGELELLELPQRVIAPASAPARADHTPAVLYQDLPPVEIVDLRAELVAGNRSIFSRALKQALDDTLARGEQAILFLNRRGTASAVVCRNCGQAVKCPRCNNPFTLHQFGGTPAQELVCHHCGKRAAIPKRCPKCGSTRIRGLGLGTEKLEEQVRAEFPLARTLRWDYDQTHGKDAHEILLDKFLSGEANVLVGTQMIAKGLDLPGVTLVGVINADTSLFLPDFRASERTFQLLTQVAGRAGRSAQRGKAILQTFNPEHYAIRAAARHDYADFYRREMEFRRTAAYPPFRPMIRLLYSADNAAEARAQSENYAAQLHDRIRRHGIMEIEVRGPAPAFFAKLRGKYRWHILVRGRDAHELLASYPPPPYWQIDVDPLNLL